MNISTLQQANDLLKEIKALEEMIAKVKIHDCEWIEFTFGNGSSRATVCNDKEIINIIRDSILKNNESKLSLLKAQFTEL